LAGHVARVVEMRGAYRILLGTSEVKRPLAGDFKHELLNRLRSIMAVNVLMCIFRMWHEGHGLD